MSGSGLLWERKHYGKNDWEKISAISQFNSVRSYAKSDNQSHNLFYKINSKNPLHSQEKCEDEEDFSYRCCDYKGLKYTQALLLYCRRYKRNYVLLRKFRLNINNGKVILSYYCSQKSCYTNRTFQTKYSQITFPLNDKRRLVLHSYIPAWFSNRKARQKAGWTDLCTYIFARFSNTPERIAIRQMFLHTYISATFSNYVAS